MMSRRSAGAAAVLAAAALAAACSQAATSDPPRVAVVVGGRAVGEPAIVDRARAVVASVHGVRAQLRVPRTPTEELAVTHQLAVEGYDAVVGIDLDGRIAIAPVARRFPRLRFIAGEPASLARAVDRASAGYL
jgi:uncharacterized protein YcfJ